MSKPVSGTTEWAKTTVDVSDGCEHGCLYCYAHTAMSRFKRLPEGGWTVMTDKPGAAERGFGKRKGTVMFPSTHDITESNYNLCVSTLIKLLEKGNDVLIVSKPCWAVFYDLIDVLQEWKEQILFRFTICSLKYDTLELWEPGAPKAVDRMMSLIHAFEFGYRTSISMEPLLITEHDDVLAAIEEFDRYVTDSIWIGKANKLEERLKRNGHWDRPEVREAAGKLIASQSDERIHALYEALKDNPKIRWKESIKTVVGLEVPTEPGLDI
jgi:DNA repair photolyase